MIQLTAEALSILQRSYSVSLRVESWYNGQLLSDDIPVVGTGATETADRSIRVPERLTFSVPRMVNGFDWAPVADDHPLAANGQQLRVSIGIGTRSNQIEWFQRGWFVVFSADPRGDTVEVEAEGLLALVDEARFTGPFQPSGNFTNTIRSLVEPALTVSFDTNLVDRAVPGAINYDEERLSALRLVTDAWPAEFQVNEDGYLYVAVPDTVFVADLALTDGVGGTVITALGNSTREGAFNLVVARGTDANGTQVQGIAYDSSGPKMYGGPFNPLPVPLFFESPLLTTNAQAVAAARTRLANIKRQTNKAFEVTMVPNPTITAGDVVSLTTDTYTAMLCTVEKLSLPYLPGDGQPMTMTVRSVT